MTGKIKKIGLPAAVIAVSWHLSFIFALGGVIGCVSTHFCHKEISKKKESVWFNFGRWNIHLHHWLMGAATVFFCWLAGILDITPKIVLGMAGGFIFHDLYLDHDWYKVVLKKQGR